MKIYTNPLVVILAAPLVFVPWLVMQHHSSGVAARPAFPGTLSGTVAEVRLLGGTTSVAVRNADQQMKDVALPSEERVLTSDGKPLATTSILPGDILATTGRGDLEDTSQEQTEIEGIVADSPDPAGDSLVVQVQPSQSVLVNIASSTHISAPVTAGSPPLAGIETGDIVRVSGILDRVMGVMTRADSIVRLGP